MTDTIVIAHRVSSRIRANVMLTKPRVIELLHQALPERYQRLRLGVAHADAEDAAGLIRDALHDAFHPVDIVVTTITAVIGVHAGPDAWGVFWQVEDGVPQDAEGNKRPGGR